MPRRVEQDVAHRVPNLAWGLQDPHVVPVCQQATPPAERAPHCPGHPPAERLHPATECMPIICLDDEVRVIPQERVVH